MKKNSTKIMLLSMVAIMSMVGCNETNRSSNLHLINENEVSTTDNNTTLEKKKREEQNTTKVEVESKVKSGTSQKSVEKEKNEEKENPLTKRLEEQQKLLSLQSSLEEERLKRENKALLQEIQKLQWEKELLSEKQEIEEMKTARVEELKSKQYEELLTKRQRELEELEHQAKILETKLTHLTHVVGIETSKLDFNRSKLESEVSILEVKEKHANFISKEVTYLDNPVIDNNKTIVISDRRIDLNDVIDYNLAERITSQIAYYNNQDPSKPIFIVIESSPGGSMMAGYNILQSMKGSQAPIYVVLKSFAASMAATIVTLADRSYAYANSVMLHHQPGFFAYGNYNLTEQKEEYESLKKWWENFGQPIAEKMGITLEEFKQQMYEHSSRGDWEEFAKDAQKLKWVNSIIEHIHDNSVRINPLYVDEEHEGTEEEYYEDKVSKKDADQPYQYLPRLRPKDGYFLYNPDGYYRFR